MVQTRKTGVATYCVNLDMVIKILGLDSQEQGSKPFKGTEISANPEEVDFPQPCASLRVVHPIPDALQDRGERRDTDTRTDQHGDFEFEDILRCRTKRSVDVDAGKNLS